MSASLLSFSRKWHRRIASLLFAFFFIVALTGLMLGWKFLFTKAVFENKTIHPSAKFKNWLPLDSLEKRASLSLNMILAKHHYQRSERAELRLAKGYISFLFPGNYNVQLDGATGETIRIEQKNGAWIQDIHDGAIIDSWIGNKSGVVKTVYSSIIGFSLLILTLSGFYLWYKPKKIKQKKNAAKAKKFSVVEVAG
jgi:uncharacterized iron-regulated membrane protein